MNRLSHIENYTAHSHRLQIWQRLLILALLTITLIAAQKNHLVTARVTAGSYVVNSNADLPDATVGDGLCDIGNGDCTLRAAIEQAQAADLSESAAVTISFAFSTPTTISLAAPLPAITTFGLDLTIQGPGQTLLTIDGGNAHRLFTIGTNNFENTGEISSFSEPEVVRIYDLTIANGYIAPADPSLPPNMGGGAIYNLAKLEMRHVTIRDSQAERDGGGIFNERVYVDSSDEHSSGELILEYVTLSGNSATRGGGIYSSQGDVYLYDTEVSDNSATADGGGIYDENDSYVELINTLVSNNRATNGGGIFHSTGTVQLFESLISNNSATMDGGGVFNVAEFFKLNNSTISGNQAGRNGGAIHHAVPTGTSDLSPPTTKLASSTIAHNHAEGSAGGLHLSGTFGSKNSIIADNISPTNPDCAVSDTITSEVVYTLVRNGAGCGDIFADSTNLVGTAANPLDAKLGKLSDNGGSTQTHALLTIGGISPARDAGDPTGCTEIEDDILLDMDQRGVSRLRDGNGDGEERCDMGAYEAGLRNDTWPWALRLDSSESEPTIIASQSIEKSGQSRWYKFSVQPGGTVQVQLSDLPANYDVTLYKDIRILHDSLLAPATNQDLIQLTAEFAPDSYAPDSYASDTYAPDSYAPDSYAPDSYAPDSYASDSTTSDSYDTDSYAPDSYAPDSYSPDAYAPDSYAPDSYAPDSYAPDLAYTSAQIRSLIGISALDGIADEDISVNTWENSNDFYIRVRGRNGAFDERNAYTLEITQDFGTCSEIDSTPPAISLVPVAGPGEGYKTLILADIERMDTSDPLMPTLEEKLAAFAARREIRGVVIDVAEDRAVSWANEQADELIACPAAKNLTANAIKNIIDGYWALNPDLAYIVVVGNDDVIPFFRHPDRAQLANENNYVPPVSDTTTSYASLTLGYVLSQDMYGTDINLSLSNTTLPIPKLAVGRLVEAPGDIITMLDAYNATVEAGTPGRVPTPQSTLVTGYDFLEDAALAIQAVLDSGIGLTSTTQSDVLITPRDLSPLSDDPRVWTADDLRGTLLANRYDVMFLAGHYSASSALAADYSTRLRSSEVVNSSVDMQNALIYSAGCHSGYNLVNDHAVPNVTDELDWAQAFAQKGATLIAGTGYQYGDTDFLEYSERLYLYFSQQLLIGAGPVAIGDALVSAKQIYLAETAQLRGIHEKSILQATLYGLPMLSIDMPFERRAPATPPPIVGVLRPVLGNPGETLRLRVADMNIPFAPSFKVIPLTNVNKDGGGDGSDEAFIESGYLQGSGGVMANPGEPTLPLEIRNVSVPGTVLRGVGFRGGRYTDRAQVTPLTGVPTTEFSSSHTSFQSNVFYPIQTWRVNYFDVLTDQKNGITRLNLTPAQFISEGEISPTGILRQWDAMDFRLYYSSNTRTYESGSIPATSSPPAIAKVESISSKEKLDFRVTVVGDPAAGVQEVWATYTLCNASRLCNGHWHSINLTQNIADSLLWEGTLLLDSLEGSVEGAVPASDIRYMVQAVNGVGLVSLHTNLGKYFAPNVNPGNLSDVLSDVPSDTVAEPAVTTLSFDESPTSGLYSAKAIFAATLTDEGKPLANQEVEFALGSQRQKATTDSNGQATVAISLLTTPGNTNIRVTFAGSPEYRASEADKPFTVSRQETVLTLSPVNTSAQLYGNTTATKIMTATLTDGVGNRLREKSIFFIISNNYNSYAISEITNFMGEIQLGSVTLPAGENYRVDAYFNGSIPLPDGTLILTDTNYLAASASGTLDISMADNTATPIPTATAPATFTLTPTLTSMFTPIPTAMPTPVSTITPTATSTLVPTLTSTFTPIPTAMPTPVSTITPTATSTPVPTNTLVPANLTGNVTADIDEVQPGDVASWTIALTNTGEIPDQNIILTAELAPNLQLAAASETAGWIPQQSPARAHPAQPPKRIYHLSIPKLNSGASYSTTLAIIVPTEFNAEVGSITIEEPAIFLQSAAAPGRVNISSGAGNDITVDPTQQKPEGNFTAEDTMLYLPIIDR